MMTLKLTKMTAGMARLATAADINYNRFRQSTISRLLLCVAGRGVEYIGFMGNDDLNKTWLETRKKRKAQKARLFNNYKPRLVKKVAGFWISGLILLYSCEVLGICDFQLAGEILALAVISFIIYLPMMIGHFLDRFEKKNGQND